MESSSVERLRQFDSNISNVLQTIQRLESRIQYLEDSLLGNEKKNEKREVEKMNFSEMKKEVEEDWPLREYVWDCPEVPLDNEGFAQSFNVEETEEFLAFFDQFGFVIIRDILLKDFLDQTVKEIWDQMESPSAGQDAPKDPKKQKGEQLYLEGYKQEIAGNPKKAAEIYQKAYRLAPELEDEEYAQKVIMRAAATDRNNPSSWDSFWPGETISGFLNNLSTHPTAWEIRQNEDIYRVFSTLMKKKNLWVSIDITGMMRPTKQIPCIKLPECPARTSVKLDMDSVFLSEIPFKDMPEWKTKEKWTHWDLNPWVWTLYPDEAKDYRFDDFTTENNDARNTGELKLQGLVALSSVKEEDGGFCAVPGFHKHLHEWAELTKTTQASRSRGILIFVPPNDSVHKYVRKIPMRAGSLLVWRSELPHCNYPNNSQNFRICQYIKMFGSKEGAEGTSQRSEGVKKLLPKDFYVSPLGEKLFSLKDWEDSQ